jgi:hypothetical protein
MTKNGHHATMPGPWPAPALITGKGFAGRGTEADLAARGITLLRPSPQGRDRPARRAAA